MAHGQRVGRAGQRGVHRGFFGARATDTSTLPAFAIAKLAQVSAAPNARIRFNVTARDPTKIVTLMTLRTSTNAQLLGVYLPPHRGRLAVAYFVQPPTVIASSIPVTSGAWHTLEVSLDLTTSPATLRVWLDSTSQPILSKTIAEPVGLSADSRSATTRPATRRTSSTTTSLVSSLALTRKRTAKRITMIGDPIPTGTTIGWAPGRCARYLTGARRLARGGSSR